MFAKKLSESKSQVVTLEKENMRMASLIKQLPKDKKALHTRGMSKTSILSLIS